jgi:hypothetical protein
LPDPVRRNRLEVALWVFSLNLPFLALRGTALTPFTKKYRGLEHSPAEIQHLSGLTCAETTY